MSGYLAFLVPAIFDRGESKDFDCDLTNDHELPEIPSMNAIINQQKLRPLGPLVYCSFPYLEKIEN